MKRDKFLKKSLTGLGLAVSAPLLITSCKKDELDDVVAADACTPSPTETDGPFPIHTPSELVQQNIIGDRVGIPLVINFTIQNTNSNCSPLEGVTVDIWQCDAKGNYSEYGGQLDGDFTNQNFLRGRQTTDANGLVTFVSIYPGWYPGRAPHLHIEVKNSSGQSLLITQTAFPEEISSQVYATSEYNGDFDTPNAIDGEFTSGAGLNRNMADNVTGNITDGFVLNEVIKVSA